MARRRKRKAGQPLQAPGYDDLANRGRDTGAATPNRIVVAETRRPAPVVIAGVAIEAARDEQPVAANYAHDPLIWMLNRGSISARLAAAGTRFRGCFNAASGGGVKAVDWAEPIGGGGAGPLFPAGVADWVSWRDHVQPALDALGLPENPQRLAAWHVLGCGKSVKAFAETVGWGGVRPRDAMQASGVLTCALTTLADHYGLEG